MKEVIITCDVIGCKEHGYKKVDCCNGWVISDHIKDYKKMEKPNDPRKQDLCESHYRAWCKLTIKLLRMDKVND